MPRRTRAMRSGVLATACNRQGRDVDFRKDRYDLFEGFTGTEDTLGRSVWGMSIRR